jgi:hypothetical protein
MRVWIDGEVKIDEAFFEAGSIHRGVIERGVNGLDGICSIDLGGRGREVAVEGILRAASGKGLDSFTETIESKMDGRVCKISIDDGREFEDVRIDIFETTEREFGGSSVSCKCKLQCKQLRSS